jgi:putative adenylate-forming enzyme
MNRPASIVAHFLRARWRWRTLRGPRLDRYRERRARAIVAFARAHSPFYAARWRGHDLADWRGLPPVDKGLMMAHFDEFNTRGIGRAAAENVALAAERSRDFRPTIGELTVGLSSGTSGHRGLFLVGPWESAAWAGTILARTLTPRPGPTRVAFFLRANSNLYEGLGGRLVRFRFFDLMAPLAGSLAALDEFMPHFIVGPPSLLGLLADAREAGRLRARPERLLAVAETLEPQDRARLAEVFAAPVGQIYQCTEGLLAISCPHGALHVQEDLVALQYEPLPGDVGRVTPLVTDLWRRTQPIIRYRLNDVLRLDPAPCPCGSPFQVIAAVEGRCDDLCTFLDPDGTPRPFFPDTIRRAILLADAPIADYRATQERPGQLRIALALPPGTPFAPVIAAVRASVTDTVTGYGCQSPDLTITEGIAPEETGIKRRRVRRLG